MQVLPPEKMPTLLLSRANSVVIQNDIILNTIHNKMYMLLDFGSVAICSTCRKHFPVLYSFMTYHRVYNQINTTGANSGAVTAYPSGPPEFTPGFQWGSCYLIFSLMCMFCRSLFVLLYLFFWSLCCLFFFDIRILITSLWYLQTLLAYFVITYMYISPSTNQSFRYLMYLAFVLLIARINCISTEK